MKHSTPRRLEFTTPRCGATWVVRFYLLWRRYSSGSSCVGRADLKMRLEWIPVIYVIYFTSVLQHLQLLMIFIYFVVFGFHNIAQKILQQ